MYFDDDNEAYIARMDTLDDGFAWPTNPVHERLVKLNRELNACRKLFVDAFLFGTSGYKMQGILDDITPPKRESRLKKLIIQFFKGPTLE